MDFFLELKNLYLIAIALTASVALAWPALMRGRSGVRSLAVHEAVSLVNQKNAVFVDIRPADQFKAGNIAQSRNLPVADIATRHSTLPKDKPLIVVCERGRSALNAASRLRKLGFQEVYSLDGGLQNWAKDGLPLSRKS